MGGLDSRVEGGIGFVQRAEGSIASVSVLKGELQGSIADLASTTGVALLSKGALTDETRAAIGEVCSWGFRIRAEKESGLSGELKDALPFHRGVGGLPNAFFHAHRAVALVPINVITKTVFADATAQRSAYGEVLNDPRLLADLTHALRSKHAPDWPRIREQIISGLFTDETRDAFINMAGNTQRDSSLGGLYYGIARDVQLCLEAKGQLVEVPWSLADAGVIDENLPHARDCRKRTEREEDSMLCTWG